MQLPFPLNARSLRPTPGFTTRRRSRLPWLACFGVVLAATPAVAAPLSLSEIVAHALEHAPAAELARLDAEQATHASSVADSAFWPQAVVTSQAGYSNRLDERLEAVDGDGRVREYGLASIGSRQGWFNFFVRQTVFDLASWKDAERAEIEARIAAVAADQRREELCHEVLERYVGALRSEMLLRYQRARIAEVARLDEHAASLLAAGRALRAERAEVALYLRESALQLQQREQRDRAARRALALAAGLAPRDEPTTLIDASMPAQVDPDDIARNLEAAPELRILALQRDVARVRLEEANAGKYPVVALGGGYSHYGAKRFDNFNDELRVGIDFTLPLFDGFRVVHAAAGATKAVVAADVRHASMLALKRARIDDLAARLDAARRSAEILVERERLGSERIRLSELALETQRGSLAIALAARREVDAVIDASAAARYEPLLLWGALLREAGMLREALAPAAESS